MVAMSVRLAREFCRAYAVNYTWLVTGNGDPWNAAAEIPVEPADVPAQHGHSEICRSLVESAVDATRASLGNDKLMKSLAELSRHAGRSEEELFRLLIWDKVKGLPSR
ncbi:MAG: hypothetical protein A2Y38_14525 [Spirochaetes bacterium GWB1_59_5]|nr:MAG: hypothetical protein A2Y38_14525 [Spirochaetes bacterium GWB1_59_5]